MHCPLVANQKKWWSLIPYQQDSGKDVLTVKKLIEIFHEHFD